MAKLLNNRHLRSFRLACEPGQAGLVEDLLRAEGFDFEPEPFSPFCRRLLAGPLPLGASLAAFFGYVYIQDRSSMLPPLALSPRAGAAVLDMCASPGSKSGFLAQLVGASGFVLANEPNHARLGVLRANLHQASFVQAATCSYPGEKLPLRPESWPYILLDPPCSGWGTENRNPRVRQLWRGAKIHRLAALQRALLRKAAELLAPGGLVLYSTCTTNMAENEEQTKFAEEELGLERVDLEPFAGFVFEERPGGGGCLLVSGDASAAQGFYLSLLRKRGQAGAAERELERANVELACIPRSALAGRICDPGLLPPEGHVAVFGGKARFLPALAGKYIPFRFAWQGALLGSFSAAGGFSLAPRMRSLLRRETSDLEPDGILRLDDIAEIRAMLAGQCRQTGLDGKEAALWWRGLPLGRMALRAGRVVAVFK